MPEAPLGPHPHGTARWQRIRHDQLTREPLCRYCAAMGRDTPATVADHIEPHRRDPEKFWHGALQSLCAPCHDGAKQAEERGSGLRGADVDGLPVDPGHPWA
jgi:5-methylcytosine-specific restriction endonuclease McrA